MSTGEIYTITFGTYSDKYLVTGTSLNTSFVLRRVVSAKTKIDAIRRPEFVHISFMGISVITKKQRKKISKTNK